MPFQVQFPISHVVSLVISRRFVTIKSPLICDSMQSVKTKELPLKGPLRMYDDHMMYTLLPAPFPYYIITIALLT